MLFDVWIFIERVFQKKNRLKESFERMRLSFVDLDIRSEPNKRFGNTFENQTEKQNSDRIPDEVFILSDEL